MVTPHLVPVRTVEFGSIVRHEGFWGVVETIPTRDGKGINHHSVRLERWDAPAIRLQNRELVEVLKPSRFVASLGRRGAKVQ